ncbi:CC171 protein, partial [Spelaeornis formosus]|nr:CC171 protein [Elachura formosa]
PSEMDTMEGLRKKLHELEQKNLEFANQHSREMSHCEKEIMKLRLELERGHGVCQALERKLSFARREAHMQIYSAEEELCDAK